MARELRVEDLPDLALGAALLGTGGGGDPYLGRLMVEQEYAHGRTVRLLDPDELDDDALVIPTAGLGAPTVMVEKLPNCTEAVLVLRMLEAHLGRRAHATMPAEGAGHNSMVPLLVGAQLGLPVVDADGTGRALPELHMGTFGAHGIPGSPLAIGGSHGECGILDAGPDNRRLEELARDVTVEQGGSTSIALYSMTGADVRRSAIPGTLTLEIQAGRAIREAREAHRDPFEALSAVFAETVYGAADTIFRGKIVDVDRKTTGGFTLGQALIESFDDGSVLELVFRNEYLLARIDGRVHTVMPDLIAVLNTETAEPITTEALRYGQRVRVFTVGAPPVMRTAEALALFGPRACGLDVDLPPTESPIH